MFCCACAGNCNHTGPHQYCLSHSTSSLTYLNGFPAFTPIMGWECPRCHRCYSPSMMSCLHCQPIHEFTPEDAEKLING